MATLNVSNASQLTAALNNANGGDTIRLAAGNYGALDLNGIQNNNLRYSSDVTITSADANNEAVFSSASIRYVTNLKFDNVDFSMVNSGANNSLVWIDNSSGITVTNATLDGYRVGGIQNGFRASNSSDVELSNSELTDFYYGAAVSRTDGLRITGNNVHGMDFDGMRFAQVQNVQITGNYLHDMHGVVNGGHRDMIQFWTEGTTAASENVNISNNKIEVGTGKMIQSIFVWNEQGNANLYKNFTIANNYIEGNHPHGITVGEANGVSISGNTVIEANSPYYQKYWEPRINVDDGAFNVRITGNTAHSIPDSEPGWIVSGNRIVAVGYGWDGSAEPSSPSTPTPSTPTPSTPGTSGSSTGTSGNDTVVGTSGSDWLHGYAGNDTLRGNAGADYLSGGTGDDIFDFDVASHSSGMFRDVLRGADGAAAFEGAGAAGGDRIDLSGIDANDFAAGNQSFSFGGTGTGQISVVELGNTSTLVRANTDGDAAFEFELIIEDGKVGASQYTAADFILWTSRGGRGPRHPAPARPGIPSGRASVPGAAGPVPSTDDPIP